MADYKDIVGTAVRNNAGTLTSAKTGELFYDSTNLDFIYRQPNVTTAGSWRTGNSLNTARMFFDGVGTQTAALDFGGYTTTSLAVTESYNGTSWTEVNDLNTARFGIRGGGTYTSALAFAGKVSNETGATESWNGSGWTEVADLNTARTFLNGNGKADDALAYGGNNGSTFYNNTETWNDTSWAEVADLSFARGGGGTAGIDKTSALVFGGYNLSPGDVRTVKVELWNGSGWSEQADLSGPAHHQMSGSGTSASALAFTGEGPGNQGRTATEEWSNPTLTVKTASTD